VHTDTHTNLFNGPLSGTTQVIWYQKGKSKQDFAEARDSEWQWHVSLHLTPLSFFTVRMRFLPPNQQRQSTEGWRLTYAIKQNLNKNNYWEVDYKIHRFQQTTLSKLHRAKVKWCKCVKRVVLRPADWNKTWMWITAVSPSAKVEKYQNTISGNSSHRSSISTRKVWLPISVPQRL